MARIRSIHPGQWTDEDFVSMSFPARLLAIALRNEADDQGVFEWKPITIKIKLFPADNVDVSELLDELVAARQVHRFDCDGKSYGAIRGFRRWQRPEKPKPVHPLPDTLREYVGLVAVEAPNHDGQSTTDRQPIDDQSSTDPRIPPQRKEVGGEEDGGGGGGGARARPRLDDATERVIEAADADPSKQAGWMTASAHVAKWLQRGLDLDLDVIPAIRAAMISRRGQGPPNGPRYFDRAIIEAHERRLQPLPDVTIQTTGDRAHGRTSRQNDYDARRAAQGEALRRLAEGG